MRIACLDFDSSHSCAERIHGSILNPLESFQNKRSTEALRALSWSNYIPGSQHSSTYAFAEGLFPEQLAETGNCSKPVPPVGRRTKRFVMGVVKCDPGRKERAPFSAVHFSRGIQNPRADGGSVYCMLYQVSAGKSPGNSKFAPRMSCVCVGVSSSIPCGKLHSRVVVFWHCKSYPSSPVEKRSGILVGYADVF